MKYLLYLSFLLFLFVSCDSQQHTQPVKETTTSILNKYEKNVRERLNDNFQKAGFYDFPTKLLIIGLKQEQRLEVFGKKDTIWYHIKNYSFTGFSGKLGPKTQQGDRQIPEGLYEIAHLNPNSSYHLSMKVNYPNDFDKEKGKIDSTLYLGNDIFIHGNNLTAGCIPIGDKAIEELFVMTKKAFNHKIEVVLCPYDFRKNNQYPIIEEINWENELYQKIEMKLQTLNLKY